MTILDPPETLQAEPEDEVCFSPSDVGWIASIAFFAGVVFTAALFVGLMVG